MSVNIQGDPRCNGNGVMYVTPAMTLAPTAAPTDQPTVQPTPQPSSFPTPKPSAVPTVKPTPMPSAEVSFLFSPLSLLLSSFSPIPPILSFQPTVEPSPQPSAEPTAVPTFPPSPAPSPEPTTEPTNSPTTMPSPLPSAQPTTSPTRSHTAVLVQTAFSNSQANNYQVSATFDNLNGGSNVNWYLTVEVYGTGWGTNSPYATVSLLTSRGTTVPQSVDGSSQYCTPPDSCTTTAPYLYNGAPPTKCVTNQLISPSSDLL